jgi:2'-5' RNA ligase
MSHRATARLFLAADPPAHVREQLAGWARGASAAASTADPPRPLRLLDPENLHLTLCFLGSRPMDEIAAIGSTLSECAADAGELSLGAPLWLPAARPRSLAVAVHDQAGELQGLHAAVIAAICEVSGWEPERRRFRAHITVARTRGRAGGHRAPSRAGGGLPATPQLRFSAESLTLYRSWLSSAGASYEALVRCELSPSLP